MGDLAQSMNPALRVQNVIERSDWWRRESGPREPAYFGLNGRPLKATAPLERIRALRIPPAWEDVHISPDPGRKVQAWGLDSKGRKQYIYSSEHVAHRDQRKWRRVLKVAEILPHLRSVTNEHLRRKEISHAKVHATVVRLICRACFRAGSERYAVSNKTFGVTTLCKRHVSIYGNNLVFTYVGKRSKDQRQVVADTPLVHIIEELLELPGERLFQYENGGPAMKPVTAASVNRYLADILGARYTSKDLRTFGATVRAATILADIGPATKATEAKHNVALTCKLVAMELGNTPAICRKAYIHPAVLEEYERAGRTVANLRKSRQHVEAEEPLSYYPEEAALMRFLQRYG